MPLDLEVHAAVAVRSGEKAIEQAPFDVVICDPVMRDGMNG